MKTKCMYVVLAASCLLGSCKTNELINDSVKPNQTSARLAAQPTPVKQWDVSQGGSMSDILTTAIPLADGGVMLGGYSNSPNSGTKNGPSYGYNDYWLINLDANGKKRTSQVVGGDNDDRLSTVLITSDNGYLLGGTSNSNKTNYDPLGLVISYKSQNARGGYDYWIVKLNAMGGKQWDKTIGGTANEQLTSVVRTTDGGYLLGGYSNSSAGGDKTDNSKGGYDYWVVKLDANGNKQWDKTIGSISDDILATVVASADGGYLLAGYSATLGGGGDKTAPGKGGTDYWVVKIDANGNKQWDKAYGTPGDDQLASAVVTADGGFLLGGTVSEEAGGDRFGPGAGRDYWVIRLNANGVKVWDRNLYGTGFDIQTSLAATADGGFLVGGRSVSLAQLDKTEISRGGFDYWIIKIDDEGSKLWDKTLGGGDLDDLHSLVVTTDGGIIAAGESYSLVGGDRTAPNYGSDDYWVIKLK